MEPKKAILITSWLSHGCPYCNYVSGTFRLPEELSPWEDDHVLCQCNNCTGRYYLLQSSSDRLPGMSGESVLAFPHPRANFSRHAKIGPPEEGQFFFPENQWGATSDEGICFVCGQTGFWQHEVLQARVQPVIGPEPLTYFSGGAEFTFTKEDPNWRGMHIFACRQTRGAH